METKNEKTAVQTVKPENIADQVLQKVQILKESGGLKLPQDYSPENALKGAFIMLQEIVDKDKKPVLQTCSKESIALCLYDMVVKGLNPMKKQCYFIAYAGKLTLSPSYFGNIATSKRAGLKSITANVIYEGDKFEYRIDAETGLKKLIEHKTDIENIDINKIKGAYAIFTIEDGVSNIEIMTKKQIEKAWQQGFAKGNSGAHNNFGDQMCIKTVINRACKTIINSSDDSYLYEDEEKITPHQELVNEMANKEVLTFADATVVEEKQPEQKEPVNTEEVKEKTKKETAKPLF